MSNKVMFGVLYAIGLALLVALFLTCVPASFKTGIGWMNFGIIILLYTAVWGRYSLLYPSRLKFAENVPILVVYWYTLGWYALATIVAMLLFWILGVGLAKQALLQVCILVVFLLVQAVGRGASHHIARDSLRISEQVGGIRILQSRSTQLEIVISSLPLPHGAIGRDFKELAETIAYIGGCDNPVAREIEARISGLLENLSAQCSQKAPIEDCRKTLAALREAVSLRRTIMNI